jgi:hypothetical protein
MINSRFASTIYVGLTEDRVADAEFLVVVSEAFCEAGMSSVVDYSQIAGLNY